MQTTVRVYFNTGFNTVNVPDGPALLETAAFSHADAQPLDLLQDGFLSNIRIRTDWNTVKNADYCKVGNFYYFIGDIQMTSGDVASLLLIPDYVTSAGGFSSLQILDGLTDRVHVVNDAFGLYGADDPYMAPAYDMDIKSFSHSFGTSNMRTFVETTLNLDALGYQRENNTTLAMTAQDLTDPDNPLVCTYPVVPTLSEAGVSGTNYTCTINASHSLMGVNGQGLYDLDTANTRIGAGIAQARSLGVEQAISGQFAIPASLVSGSAGITGYLSQISGTTGNVSVSTIPFEYKSGVSNKRVFYGNYTPYTIISSVGNAMTANAEEIYNGGSAPTVKYVSDPRRTGKPYFRFKNLNGVDVDSNEKDFFRGCVAGKEWNNVPLVLTEKSGSVLDFIQYRNSLASNQLAVKQLDVATDFAKTQMITNGVSGLANGVSGSISGNAGSAQPLSGGAMAASVASSILAATTQAGFGIGGLEMNAEFARQRAAMDRAIESQRFQIQQNVKIPDVKFTVDPDLCSEITGNGFMVYRAVYKDADITRIDKILTAFGYKFTKVLETTDFFNRTYFNYVSGSISVGGNLPRWWANGIAGQINGGVRIWHVKPNPSYYTNNPVRV